MAMLAIGWCGSAMAAVEAPVSALYVFGDSYSDIGERYLDGNGSTAPGHLAKALGLDMTFAKDPNGAGKSLNFAATGATTGDDKGEGEWCCKGMMNQVQDFTARVKAGKISFKPESTLFFLAGGLNNEKIPNPATLNHLRREIKLLQEVGARHFTLSLLPTKVPDFAKIGKRLNPAYQTLVKELSGKGVDITLNHWGSYLDQIIDNPKQYGLVNTTGQCAGRELFKEDPTPCANPDGYFYFHGGHPSNAVNKIVGEKLHQELMAAKKL
jgi:phospholipase/lecithinase/hemolysin